MLFGIWGSRGMGNGGGPELVRWIGWGGALLILRGREIFNRLSSFFSALLRQGIIGPRRVSNAKRNEDPIRLWIRSQAGGKWNKVSVLALRSSRMAGFLE